MTETKPTTIMVCINRRFRTDEPSCAQRGSERLAELLEQGIQERRIDITLERSICMGHCRTGPTVRLAPGGRFFHGPPVDTVPELLDELESLCGTRDDDPSSALHLLGS